MTAQLWAARGWTIPSEVHAAVNRRASWQQLADERASNNGRTPC